jgi:hypothetical protein
MLVGAMITNKCTLVIVIIPCYTINEPVACDLRRAYSGNVHVGPALGGGRGGAAHATVSKLVPQSPNRTNHT